MADVAQTHPGLPNVGNSCFLNVVLQSLAAAQPLRAAVQLQPSADTRLASAVPASPAVAALHDLPPSSSATATATATAAAAPPPPPPAAAAHAPAPPPAMPITTALLQVLTDMWHPPESSVRTRPQGSQSAVHVIDPKLLLAALKKRFPDLVTGQQQDAHEALSLLLDACQMEEKDALKAQSQTSVRRLSSTPSISTSEPSAASSSPPQPSDNDKLPLVVPSPAEGLPPTHSAPAPQSATDPCPAASASTPVSTPGHHLQASCPASQPPKRQGTFPYGLSPPAELDTSTSLSDNNPYARLLSPKSVPMLPQPNTSPSDTAMDPSTPTPHDAATAAAFRHSSHFPQIDEPAAPAALATSRRAPASVASTSAASAASGGSLDRSNVPDDRPRHPLVDQIFEGKLASTIICQACGYVSQTYEPFYDLSLSLPHPSTHGAPTAQSKKRMAFLRLSERLANRTVSRSRPDTPGASLLHEDGSGDMPAAAGTSFSPSMAKAVQRTAASLSRPGSAAADESSLAAGNPIHGSGRKLWVRSTATTPNSGQGPNRGPDTSLGPRPASAVPARVASWVDKSMPSTPRPPSAGPGDASAGKERRRFFSRTPKPETATEDEDSRGTFFRRRTTLRKAKRGKEDTAAPPLPLSPPVRAPAHAPVARHTNGLDFTDMTKWSESLDDNDLPIASPQTSPGEVHLGLPTHTSPLATRAGLAPPIPSAVSPGPGRVDREATLLPHDVKREDTLTPDLVGKLEAAALNTYSVAAAAVGAEDKKDRRLSNLHAHQHKLHRPFRRSFRPHGPSDPTLALTSTLSESGQAELEEVPPHLLYIAQLLSGSPRKAVDPSVLYALRDAASSRRGKLSVADVAAACASAAQTGTSLSVGHPAGALEGAEGQAPGLARASSGAGAALRAQEGTGLVAALNTFTQSELLEGEDAFLCKRCWRNQHGLRARSPSLRTEEGSDSSPDADSDYDQYSHSRSHPHAHTHSHTPGLGLTGVTQSQAELSGSARRASISVPTLHTRTSAASLGDGDAWAPMLRSRTGSATDEANGWASDASASVSGAETGRAPAPAFEVGVQPANVLVSGPGASTADRGAATLSERSASTTSKPIRRRAGRIRQPALKRYLIASVAPVLVIQLKRFAHTSGFGSGGSLAGAAGHGHGHGEKLDEFVSFPPVLDVAPWLAPPRESYDRYGRPKCSTGAGPLAIPLPHTAKQHEATQYALVAVIVHTGQLAAGHYTAFVLDTLDSGAGKFWVHVSDESVRHASWEEVSKAKAYMLFYQRIEPPGPGALGASAAAAAAAPMAESATATSTTTAATDEADTAATLTPTHAPAPPRRAAPPSEPPS